MIIMPDIQYWTADLNTNLDLDNFQRKLHTKESNIDIKLNKNINLPLHLGGHCNITHVDNGAISWAKNELSVKSFLDVGCGPGGMVELAKEMGLVGTGIDGDYTIASANDDYIIHDYTTGPYNLEKSYDLGWSVEFLEHVEEKYMHNYMKTFTSCKYLIITHALPDTPGVHHVNCKSSEYWINKFNTYGFEYSVKLTRKLKEVSTMNIHREEKKQFIRKTGKLFINRNLHI